MKHVSVCLAPEGVTRDVDELSIHHTSNETDATRLSVSPAPERVNFHLAVSSSRLTLELVQGSVTDDDNIGVYAVLRAMYRQSRAATNHYFHHH